MLIRDLSTSPWPILHNRITATLLDAFCATCATAHVRSLNALRGKTMLCSGWAVGGPLRQITDCGGRCAMETALGKGSLAGPISQGSSRLLDCLMLVLGA